MIDTVDTLLFPKGSFFVCYSTVHPVMQCTPAVCLLLSVLDAIVILNSNAPEL